MKTVFRQTATALLLLCLCFGASRQLRARDLLFGAIGHGNPSDLFILNPSNGSVALDLGPTGFSITGLAFDPTTGILYGSTANRLSNGDLIRLNPATGAGTLVGNFGVANHSMADITFTKNGTLYGWAEPGLDDLHVINKATGAATDVGNAGISTYGSGLAANSKDVLFYAGSGNTGPLRTINKTSGLPTTVATLSGGPLFPGSPIDALAFNSADVLYGVNGSFGGGATHLIIINTVTGVITDVGPSLNGLDAIAFLNTNDPEEFSAIYQIGFSQATALALTLQHRMDDIRAGSRSFCPTDVVVELGKDYSGGKGATDGKVVLPTTDTPVMSPAPENKWGFFITGTGQLIDIDDSGFSRPGYDISTGGVTLGVDYRVCANFAVGLYGDYAHSTADFDNQLGFLSGGDVTVDSGKIGMYATWFSGGFYVDGAVGGGYNSYDTRRADVFGFERGSTDGTEFSTFGAAGYDWHVGCWVFGPTASVQYTKIDLNGFTEDRSSILALQFPDQSEDSLRSMLGLRVSHDWKLWRGIILRNESRGAWKHEFNDTAYGIQSRFALSALGSSILTVHGPDTGRDSAIVSSAVSVLWNDRISTYLYYDTEYGRKNYDDAVNVSGGIRVSF
jgi:outer membrane autotransporter protein